MSEVDVFEGSEPIKGLEHLGRAIVDANGMPSGSPANFEATRGKGAYVPTEDDKAAAAAAIANDPALNAIALEPKTPEEPEAHPWAKDSHDW